MKPTVKDFLGKPAPQGYVAGSLRGDVGFMTRPDLVHGKAPIPVNSNYSDRGGARPRAKSEMAASLSITQKYNNNQNQNEDEDDGPTNLNDFSTLRSLPDEHGLLAGGSKAADDLEADSIYANIDSLMASRRKKKSSIPSTTINITNEEGEGSGKGKKNKLVEREGLEFAKLKNELSTVSDREWSALPESGDFRAKKMKKINPKERYTPLPDTTIIELNSEHLESKMSIMEEDSSLVSLARKKVLGNRLDTLIASGVDSNSMDDRSLSPSLFDPEAYLRGLLSKGQTDVDQKARTLLKSILSTDKNNPDAWLMAIKLEYNSGNLKYARKLMEMALESCPQSEELWIWYVKELEPKNASLVNRALSSVPGSIYLWMEAIKSQSNPISKRGTLLKALNSHPKNKDLWIELLKLETTDKENRILLLKKAVDCLPNEVDFWIDLVSHTSDREEAKKIINTARRFCPQSHEIWIIAALLEGNPDIIIKGMRTLPEAPWLDSAIMALNKDHSSFPFPSPNNFSFASPSSSSSFIPLTIIRELNISKVETIKSLLEKSMDIGEMVLKNLMTNIIANDDNGNSNDNNSNEIEIDMNAILNLVKDKYCFKGKKAKAKEFYEMIMGTKYATSDFWLSYINDVNDSVDALEMAIKNNIDNNEDVVIAIAKKLKRKGLKDRALNLLHSQKPTSKILSKIIGITGNVDLARESVEKYPLDGCLWLKLCRLDSSQWSIAISKVKNYAPLWIEASLHQPSIKSRAILEQARKLLPQSKEIWIASIELEHVLNQEIMAKHLLIQALKIHPSSPSIILQAFIDEHKINLDNLEKGKSEGDGYAALFMAKAIIAKYEDDDEESKRLFKESLKFDPDNRDILAAYLKLHGNINSFSERSDNNDSDNGNYSSDHYDKLLFPSFTSANNKKGAKWNFWKLKNCQYKSDFYRFVNEMILLKSPKRMNE